MPDRPSSTDVAIIQRAIDCHAEPPEDGGLTLTPYEAQALRSLLADYEARGEALERLAEELEARADETERAVAMLPKPPSNATTAINATRAAAQLARDYASRQPNEGEGARVERLESALERIANHEDDEECDGSCSIRMAELARAALSGEGEKD